MTVEPIDGQWAEPEAGLWIAIQGYPRWSEPRLEKEDRARGSGGAIAAAYRERGERLFELIRGSFSLVLVDTVRGRVIAAVDRTGQRQLYHATHGEHLAIATTAGGALAAAGLDRRLAHQQLFHYLYFHMIPAPGTAFEGVHKLPGAHFLGWQGGEAKVAPYWVPEFSEPASASAAELMDLLRKAVGHAAQGESIGAFLSGGLDSSTVSGLLAELRPGEADTYSIGFDAEGYDEMAYARIAMRHFGTRAHEYYVTPEDVVGTVPKIAAAYDEPFGNSSALPAYFCARMAADAGTRHLLAGDGGDELFAGNERYAKQGVFERWGRLPGSLRKGVLEPVLTNLPGRPNVLRKARSYVEQARTPLPDRLQSYNFLHRLDPAEVLTGDFLETIDLDAPLELQRSTYRRPAHASALNRMMYLDWQITLADNDLRKVTRMCELADIEVSFPMLDDDLVEYSLRIPSRLKLRNGRLRHFYKEATKDFLPREIIDKRKHGFGLPFGVWMGRHAPLRDLAYDSLSNLKKRGYIRPEFIDEAIRLHREGHAGYYGELIWVLMMLELWMEGHST
ncbi:asparagine synthase [Thioalkalivibrio denitrificans]|uniref:asparagine synthase (glutamine-hydrolyzing) n=1 Tax=Thioalkalivibrio denitrificans TaxID=108003 RepID=A0A1V3NCH7_9GAMM|nr:asparagine synthase C-terminal domain-containing protein [Thioalkalivibrio denitrificans]OOG22751.1 asparagine synthase [Thioalkalivibrio denitrificans]